MKSYVIRWKSINGYQQSERIACEDFEDAVSRLRMKASLCDGTPIDAECFGDITVLESAEVEYDRV